MMENLHGGASKRLPNQMPEPPQKDYIEKKEQWFCSKVFPDVWAPHLMCTGKPSHPMKETTVLPAICVHYLILLVITQSSRPQFPFWMKCQFCFQDIRDYCNGWMSIKLAVGIIIPRGRTSWLPSSTLLKPKYLFHKVSLSSSLRHIYKISHWQIAMVFDDHIHCHREINSWVSNHPMAFPLANFTFTFTFGSLLITFIL